MSRSMNVGVVVDGRLGLLQAVLPSQGPRVIDLRLVPRRVHLADRLEGLDFAPGDWVVAPASRAAELPDTVDERVLWRSPECPGDAVAGELAQCPASVLVNDVSELSGLPRDPRRVLVAGWEGGGLVSEETTLIVLRRVLAATERPVWVLGGLGPDGAAAAVAAGARGVVLGEVLWATPEAGSPPELMALLEKCDPSDTDDLGRFFDFRFRVFRQLATRPPRDFEARELVLSDRPRAEAAPRMWRWLLDQLADASHLDPDRQLVPLGQLGWLAGALRDRLAHADRILDHYRDVIETSGRGLQRDYPLAAGARFARRFGSAVPVCQGPMSHVSDVPEFIDAVERAGVLPWVAFSNTPDYVAEPLLDEVRERMGERPFGVGIIGMESNRYRDAHIELLLRSPPPYVMVAAGSIEQALRFERAGITTFVHAPVATQLRAAIHSGIKNLVLEGAEAGGHVGKLGLVALVQQAVDLLLAEAREGRSLDELSVVVAGGVSDPVSARFAAALLYRLHALGAAVAVQMGTAFLLTREARDTGAVSACFQEMALAGRSTRLMGRTVNTPTRVLSSPAAQVVIANEEERLRAGAPLRERKHLYEDDNFGGLMAAAKAKRVEFTDETRLHTRLVPIDRGEQRRTGLFHAGQTVALVDRVQTAAELVDAVTTPPGRAESRNAPPKAAEERRSMGRSARRQETTVKGRDTVRDMARDTARDTTMNGRADWVAIVGLGAKVPDALSAGAFWRNLLAGHDAVREVDPAIWDPALYWDPDPAAPDKTYSKIGGFVRGFEFDRKQFRIPPKVVQSIDNTQQLALAATVEALEDAGLVERDFDRDRCAVIVGNAQGGWLREKTDLRIHFPTLATALVEAARGEALDPRLIERLVARTEAVLKRDLPPVTEDTMPGELANVVAGRLANLLDLRGPNYITDAACASSLAAVDAAIRGLRTHAFDLAVSGGVDRCMSPATFTKFSKIGALSPDGSRPFDAAANGFVMGEGAVILVLKRLADALRDGDRVYAVIRGIGGASDGRGKGITAPNPQGQLRALRAAYSAAGVAPQTLGMLEAHGTSTRVGDVAEVESFALLFNGERAAQPISLGSVKSNIGHLKAGAGAAGLFKAAMALYHKVLPPTCNVETPNPRIDFDAAPLRIQTAAEPWERNGHPRRAGVSAFGFGGTNFHAVLEELDTGGANRRGARNGVPVGSVGVIESVATRAQGPTPVARSASPVGASAPPLAAVGIAAQSVAALSERLDGLIDDLGQRAEQAYAEHQLPAAGAAVGSGPVRLAIAAPDVAETLRLARSARSALQNGRSFRILENQGVFLRQDVDRASGPLGFVFTGQGSQYLNMGADLRSTFEHVDAAFRRSDALLETHFGRKLSSFVFVPEASREAFEALSHTSVTQPAVLTLDLALLRILEGYGLSPEAVAGHSLGEYGACVAAGVLSADDAIQTVAVRGRAMADAQPPGGDCGLMASIPMDAAEVAPQLKPYGGRVVVANVNSPRQTIIAGSTPEMRQAVEAFEASGVRVVLLKVSHAFHTQIVAPASGPLRRFLDTIAVRSPRIPVVSNVDATDYPDDPAAIRELLAQQLARPVAWRETIERMYASGIRTFIEVGPKRALTSFVSDTLGERPHRAYGSNHPKFGGPASLARLLGALWADGVVGEVARHGVGASRPPLATDPAAPGNGQPRGPADGPAVELGGGMLGWASTVLEKGSVANRVEARPVTTFDEPLEERRGGGNGTAVTHGAAGSGPLGWASSFIRPEAVETQKSRRLQRFEQPEPSDRAERFAADTDPDGLLEPSSSMAVEVADSDGAYDVLLAELCTRTGYDPDEIEPEFELEADLGVDTVKQAEILSAVRERFGLPRDESFRLADYPTLASLAGYLAGRLRTEAAPAVPGQETDSNGAQPSSRSSRPSSAGPSAEAGAERAGAGEQTPAAAPARPTVPENLWQSTYETLLGELCERTGYDPDEIEPEFELEADLGVDTVKQAEILSAVRERYRLPRDESFRLADYPTLADLTAYLAGRLTDEAAAQEPAADDSLGQAAPGVLWQQAYDTLLAELCERTGYDPGEIEPEFELEADLGVDTVKQAEILSAVRERFELARDDNFRLADYPTLRDLADYLAQRLGSPGGEEAPAAVQAAAESETSATSARVKAGLGRLDPASFGLTAVAEAEPPRSPSRSDESAAPAPSPSASGGSGMLSWASKALESPPSEVASEAPTPEAPSPPSASGGSGMLSWASTVLESPPSEAASEAPAPEAPSPPSASGGSGMLSWASAVLEAPSAPARAESVEASASPSTVDGPSDADLTIEGGEVERAYEALLAELCERTGYDPSEIEPTFELEADLGVDTVKQAEILSAVRERFELRRDDGFRLADYPTLRELAGYLAARLTADEGDAEVTPTADSRDRAENDESIGLTVGRFRPVAVAPAELPPVSVSEDALAAHFSGRAVLLLDVDPALRTSLEVAFERLGASPWDVTDAVDDEDLLASRLRRGLADRELAVVCAAATRTGDPVAVGLRVFRLARSVAQAVSPDGLAELPWLSLTRTGGQLGFQGSGTVAGVVAGMTKSLALEWQNPLTRVVDLAEETIGGDEALTVLAQAFLGSEVESGWAFGRRYVLADAPVDRALEGGLGTGEVFLITGGARGITARVAIALAERFGGRLALLGRTAHQPGRGTRDLDVSAEKRRIRELLAARHERVTPAMVRDQLAPLLRSAEVEDTLQAVRASGAEAVYCQADVTDGEAVARAVETVTSRFGPITAVIHGAGVEASKALADKSEAEVERVLATKLTGAALLWRALRGQPVRVFAGFGSVAGRFGNAGQVEYGGANDGLSKWLLDLRARHPALAALAIDWTAWDDVGMAVDAGLRGFMQERGIELLPGDEGARICADLLAAGVAGEVLVAGQLGDLRQAATQVGPAARPRPPAPRKTTDDVSAALEPEPSSRPKPASSAGGEMPPGGLLDTVSIAADGQSARAGVLLEAEEPYLDHHRMEGTPVLPGVMAIEIGAQLCARLAGSLPYRGVSDARFERPAKLYRDGSLQLVVEARRSGEGDGRSASFDVVIGSLRPGRTGRDLVTQHFRGTFHYGTPEGATEHGRLRFELSRPVRRGIDRGTIYEHFFHTGTFAVVDALHAVGEQLAVGEGRTAERPLSSLAGGERLLTEPLATELAVQVGALWGLLQRRGLYLPAGIGRSRAGRPVAPGTPVTARVALREASQSGVRVDAEVLTADAEARLVVALEDVELAWVAPAKDHLAEVVGRLETMDLVVATAAEPEVPAEIFDGPNGLVSEVERPELSRKRVEKARREWLLSRWLLKGAVADFYRRFYGLGLKPGQIRLAKDANGAPSLAIEPPPDISAVALDVPPVSLSHSGGRALFAIVPPWRRVLAGVDLERVEARLPRFASDYFSERELAAARGRGSRDAVLTAMWSLKEAASKALRLGAQLDFRREIEVVDLAERSAELRFEGRALEQLARLRASFSRAFWRLEDGFASAGVELSRAG